MKFLNTDAIHKSGTLLYNKPVKENFKITTAPCPVFKDNTYIEFNNYATYTEKDKTNNFNFQKVEFYYEPTIDTENIPESDYPEVDEFTSEDGIVVKVYKLIGIIGTNLFGEQNIESNISQLCLYRAFELTNDKAETAIDKYNITYYLYSYYSKGNLDYSKRYYLGETIPSGKYEVSYSSLTLNDKAIKGEAIKVDPKDIKYTTTQKYPIFGHSSLCASGKYYELKIYKSDNECPIYLPMQEDTAGKSNNLVVNVNYSGMVNSNTTEYYHTINNLDSWSTQSYCMYNTIHGYTTDITNANLKTIKYFPVTNNESINDFSLGGVKHDSLKTGINNFENIVLVPNSTFVNQTKTQEGYKVSEDDYINEVIFKYNSNKTDSFNSVLTTNYVDETMVGNTKIIRDEEGYKGWCIYSDNVVKLNKNELYKFTAKLTIKDDKLKTELDSNNIVDIKFVLLLDYDNYGETRFIEFNNNCLKSNVGDPYTIDVVKYFTVPVNQATSGVKLACSSIVYKYVTDTAVETGTLLLNIGFTITNIKLYKLTPKNETLSGTFYTKYAYNTDTYIGQDTFTLYDNDTHDSEVYREWYYYLDGSKFENNYTNIKITPLDTTGTLTCTVDSTNWELLTKSGNKTFTASAKFEEGDVRIKLFNYVWTAGNNDTLKNLITKNNKQNNPLKITRNQYDVKHLNGGTATITCTATLNSGYGITPNPSSTSNVISIEWAKINSSITASSQSITGVTNNTIYIGKKYTGTFTITTTYPLRDTNPISINVNNTKLTFASGPSFSISSTETTWKTNGTYNVSYNFIVKTKPDNSVNQAIYINVTDQNSPSTTKVLQCSPNNLSFSKYDLIITTNLVDTNLDLYKTDGNTKTLTFVCTADANLANKDVTYQWYKDGVVIEGAKYSTYIINSADADLNPGTYEYYCIASNIYSNSKTSGTVTCRIIEDNDSIVTVGSAFSPVKTINEMNYYIPDNDTVRYKLYGDVQTAIDAAESAGGGEVWIAKGTYKHGSEMTMKNNVAIYGGFAGTETSKDQRVSGNNTILDGEGEHRVFYNNYTDETPLTNSAKLDNVTIQNGYAYGNNTSDNYGAGMYNYYASPEITNCTFTGNKSDNGVGGGMYNGSSSPVLANCTFMNNSASSAGGMRNDYSSSPVLANCTFMNNSASAYGGGMYNGSSSPSLANCTFMNNSASSAGGMYNFSSSPTLINCTFYKNRSSSFATGGGDYGGGGISNHYFSNPVLKNCTFTNNYTFYYGGGAFNGDSSCPVLTNCILWGNTASSSGNEIYNSGSNNKPTIDTCIIKGGVGDSYGTYTNIITTDPKLMDLDNYGGFVQTCAVESGSSAIGKGKVITGVTTDARDYIRSTTAPTIGAYEYNGTPPS